jgi:hypothetical protein
MCAAAPVFRRVPPSADRTAPPALLKRLEPIPTRSVRPAGYAAMIATPVTITVEGRHSIHPVVPTTFSQAAAPNAPPVHPRRPMALLDAMARIARSPATARITNVVRQMLPPASPRAIPTAAEPDVPHAPSPTMPSLRPATEPSAGSPATWAITFVGLGPARLVGSIRTMHTAVWVPTASLVPATTAA